MDATELTQLQAACTKARADYRAARIALAAVINKTPDSDAVAELVVSTQELGLNATLHRLKTKDKKIEAAINRMVEASDVLGLAVGAREQFLTRNNPDHRRVYVEDGREFTLDVEKGVWTYLDDPKNPIKVTLTRQTKLDYGLPGFKGPEEDVKQPKKTKKLRPKF